MVKQFKPGFYENIQFPRYLEDPAINNSGLKIFNQSPAKFKHWAENDRPGTSTQVEGSALHCAILEPKQFSKRFGKGPAPKKRSAGRTKWDKSNSCAMALTPRQWDNVNGMSDAFRNTSCSVAHELLSGGISELSIWWDDPVTGVRCKIRPDYCRDDDIVIDLKSTQAGSPKGFLGEAKRWGYDRQSAWYECGMNAAYRAAGVNRHMEAFIFICVENFPPHLVSIYMLPESIVEDARQQVEADLEKYAKCMENDIWPGYENKIVVLGND